MPFHKGHKLSGSRKGKPNKVTASLKERWADFVEENFDKVQGWFDHAVQENPTEGLRLYLQFSERILGKVSTSNVDLTSNGKELKAPIIYAIGDPPATDQI